MEQDVRQLLETEGPDLLTWGSSDLLRQLLAAGLVDVFRLIVYPVVLGQGKRLFHEDTMPSAFQVVEAATSPSGVQVLRLEDYEILPSG